MNYVDEAKNTTCIFANHKTNAYINASSNVHSYCGLVHEAFKDKNFNAIIYEVRDQHGRKAFYMKQQEK